MTSAYKFLLLLLVLSTTAFADTAHHTFIVRFKLTDSLKTFLRANEFDITGVNYRTGEIEALMDEKGLRFLKTQRPDIIYTFPQNLALAPDLEYKNPQEIEEFVKDIHARFPNITKLAVIGKSLEGRNIWAVRITGEDARRAVKPVILVNAMHHAREVMTPEITTDMIGFLTANYGNNPEVTRWVDSTVIWVVPMFNVDGNNRMWNSDPMWRKNTRGGYGVDINRNYPAFWNTCKGSSSWTFGQDYRGPAPASEPETQAMMNLVSQIKPVFNISYHSYSEIVIYPFGCKPNRTPTTEAVETIGREIGQKLNYKPGTAWELLYNVDGGDIDWMYTAHQVIPYVIEVNSTNEGFHPNYRQWRDKTVQRNRAGWMHLLNKLQGPSLQGRVNPRMYSNIKITRAGDKSVVQDYKINPDGSYFIILNPGKYDFVFEGQKNTKFSNQSISSKKLLTL